jgi:hypothetical protein
MAALWLVGSNLPLSDKTPSSAGYEQAPSQARARYQSPPTPSRVQPHNSSKLAEGTTSHSWSPGGQLHVPLPPTITCCWRHSDTGGAEYACERGRHGEALRCEAALKSTVTQNAATWCAGTHAGSQASLALVPSGLYGSIDTSTLPPSKPQNRRCHDATGSMPDMLQ